MILHITKSIAWIKDFAEVQWDKSRKSDFVMSFDLCFCHGGYVLPLVQENTGAAAGSAQKKYFLQSLKHVAKNPRNFLLLLPLFGMFEVSV